MAAIVKRDPFANWLNWPRWFEDFEDNFQKGLRIHETDKDIVAEAVVAGVPAKEVDVEIEDGVLTIKGETKEERENEKGYKVSSYKYYYTCALSGGQWDKTEAEVKNGILKVTIPKTKAARPKKVTVQAKEK